MCVFVRACLIVDLSVRVRACVFVRLCLYLFVGVHLLVCLYVCVCGCDCAWVFVHACLL